VPNGVTDCHVTVGVKGAYIIKMMTKGAPDVDEYLMVFTFGGFVLIDCLCGVVLYHIFSGAEYTITGIGAEVEGEPPRQEGDNCDHPGG